MPLCFTSKAYKLAEVIASAVVEADAAEPTSVRDLLDALDFVRANVIDRFLLPSNMEAIDT